MFSRPVSTEGLRAMIAIEATRRQVLAAGGGLAAGVATKAAGMAADGASGLGALLSDGPDGVLCAGMIVRGPGGRVVAAQAVGRRYTGSGQAERIEPFGLDDPFRTASVSKLITTTGFMRLVSSGQVALGDDASDPLGFRLRHPAWPDRPITIRQLLSHTSSLRNGPSYPVPAGHTLADAFHEGGRHFDGGAWFGPAEHAPGDWFAYADVNFCLIAQIIERITGERFDRYMTRTVLAPMTLDSGYNWSGVSQAKRSRAASARRWLDGRWTAQTDAIVPPAPEVVYPQPPGEPPVAEQDLRLGENGFLFSPLGGLRVSLRDLDRLAALYAAGGSVGGVEIVSARSLGAMTSPVWRYDPDHPNGETDGGVWRGYGLAVQILQEVHGPQGDAYFGDGSADWRGHLGDAYGWLAGLFWNRRTGASLVYALNGMRETGRRPGRRCALTAAEEALIDQALGIDRRDKRL
jgi:CubicO group peptidase (beta-lactamase class C family)